MVSEEGKRRGRKPQVVSVTHEAERQGSLERFSVPIAALKALGFKEWDDWNGHEVRLSVERLKTSERLPTRNEKLTSGAEVYWHGPSLQPYEPIRVTVWKP